MKRLTIFSACFAFLFFVGTAQASLVNVSISPDDWGFSSYTAQDSPTPTITQVGTSLRGTVLTANAGSAYGMEIETNNSYNFQNATLRFKWRVNGLGSYSQASTHLSSSDGNVSHKISSNGADASFTTHHSFAGSQTIADNVWLYTEITYQPAGLDFSVSYDGYDSSPISSGTNAYTSVSWDRLDDAVFRFRLVDNYKANQYFELDEVSIIAPEVVPLPASILLFGSAFFGLVGIRRRNNKG